MSEQVPFDITDEVEVADLTDVKQDRNLFPVCKGLKVRINKAAAQQNKDKDISSLKLDVRPVDGIEVTDPESGETLQKYVNAPIFTSIMDLVYAADMSVKGRADSKWWKANQHLVEFKNLCVALDIPLKGIKVNDEWLANLIGKEILVSVKHEKDTQKDEHGKKVDLGTFSQRLYGWRKVS
jgi:hypothetical protein